MSADRWRPGRDRRAVRHPGRPGSARIKHRSTGETPHVVVAGGGLAGIAAAVGLAERGVRVTLIEPHPQLGGRVRAWPVGDGRSMSRGFHAFFRQYYNLRALLRRFDPTLAHLVPVPDYPLVLAGSHTDSFATIPPTPPLNLAAFVARSPSFRAVDLTRVDIAAALELLDVRFPQTFSQYDGESAAAFLDRLRFPERARHLALEVFARSFFAHPADFSAGELVAMFHTYFVGSAEGLLFDVPDDDYDTACFAPLRDHLERLGVDVRTGRRVEELDTTDAATDAPGSGPLTVWLDDGALPADAVVLAADPAATRSIVGASPTIGTAEWRAGVAATRNAPPFAVWRLWLDRPVAPERPAFLGTSGFGPLDNVTVLERFETGAARWAAAHGGSVVELHAYAAPADAADPAVGAQLRERLRAELARVYPETTDAGTVADEWLVQDDCPLVGTGPWAARPGVTTPDPRVLLAGDWVRCDLPVALMERATVTGFSAANELLSGWGVAGHDLWTVPMAGRIPGVGPVRRALSRR
ncbi:FAD-dependent oxidoreductase [Nakamurella leprariae]|uniref:FAD-dependent oxidoreductase n=1 Tax=Nakamurella leprariae TaxID=2803911 RepID=A0A939BZR4_9ACTN|nr:FAD-dependent oxidoreductase [Nakamurella leprariae]MBM9467981.1 FAD-dependent oxidoreductase [Nakamurella leprariae]